MKNPAAGRVEVYKSRMSAFIVMLIKPFVGLPFFAIAAAGRRAVEKWPDSRLKRFLLISWKA